MELPTEELLNNEYTGERDKLSTHKVLWFTVAYSSIAQSSEVIEYFSSSSCFPPVESSEDIWSEGPASGQQESTTGVMTGLWRTLRDVEEGREEETDVLLII